MKKLILAITGVILAATAMTSCMKTEKQEENLVAAGYWVYLNMAIPQIYVAEDPARMALRFNILLATARSLMTDMDKVTIVRPETGYQVSFQEFLFDNAQITETAPGSGIWELWFDRNHKGEYDNYRSGRVRIDTRGKTLEELSNGEQWTISVPDGNYTLGFNIRVGGNPTYFNIELPNHYTMTSNGGNSWKVYSAGMSGLPENETDKSFRGDWTANYTLEYDQPNMTWTNYKVSTFTVRGGGQGQAAGTTTHLDYVLQSSLRFNNICSGGTALIGGVEEIYFEELAAKYPETYLDNMVRIKWLQSNTSGCGGNMQLSYNGYTYLNGTTKI